MRSKELAASSSGRDRGLSHRLRSFDDLGVVVALAALVVVIGVLRPSFVSIESVENVTRQAAVFGIIALGMVFLLAMREIDLSVGSIYGLVTVSIAVLIRGGLDPWLAAAIGIGLGAVLGAVNGLLANALKLPAIIVTLGTLSMYRGLTHIVSDGRTIADFPRDHPMFRVLSGEYLGLPAPLWVAVGLTVVLSILFGSTRFGVMVRAIGSNEQVARLSGVPIGRIRLLALVLVGALCGIAAVLSIAIFRAADPNVGVGWEMLAIASAIIGGTSLAGGSGTVLGALVGALIIAVIRSGLIHFGVTANWSIFATGAVIIGAVTLDGLIRRRRRPEAA